MKDWIDKNRVILGILVIFFPVYAILLYYSFVEGSLLDDFKMLILTCLTIVLNFIGLKLIMNGK